MPVFSIPGNGPYRVDLWRAYSLWTYTDEEVEIWSPSFMRALHLHLPPRNESLPLTSPSG